MNLPAMYGEKSPHLDLLFTALSQFHGEMGNVSRNADGEYGRYLDLAGLWEAARAAMSNCGICVTQLPVPYGQDGTMAIHSILGHSSGQYLSSCVPLPLSTLRDFAGDTTHVRRVVMAAMLGIAADIDEDGIQAQERAVVATPAALTKYAEIAQRTLEAAELEDRGAIHVKIHDHVAGGRITVETQRDLLAQFPIPKPKRQEVAHA